VVLLFFDATQPISKVDKQLGDYIGEHYKPCIFVVNKWDLLAGSMPTEKWVRYLHDTFRSMWHVPIAFVTGQTGKNVKALLNHGQMLFKQSQERVSTADLNRVVRAAVETNPPPLAQNKRPKIYYGTQVGVQPPTIVLFCNDPRLFKNPYRKYLLGVFRDHLPFAEVPIKLYLRRSEEGRGVESNEATEPNEEVDSNTASHE
jgi:GTPase